MRILKTKLIYEDLKPHLTTTSPRLSALIPSAEIGIGMLQLNEEQMAEIERTGTKWMVQHGYGITADLENITLNENHSGNSVNQTIKICSIEQIIDTKFTDKWALTLGQIIILIQTKDSAIKKKLAQANRQLITHQIRLGFEDMFGSAKGHIDTIYDGAPINFAKLKTVISIK